MTSLVNLHDDMIHDCALDYYSRRLATCSSDKTIKLFEVEGENHRLIDTLKGHDGPVWQVSWAHPKFGNILASAGYDGKVIVWQERGGAWGRLTEFADHTASVNSVQWSPHELGGLLACGSSDGRVSVYEIKDDGSWDKVTFMAHGAGVNAVSWAPATAHTSVVSAGQKILDRRFVTGGSDNLVKIWRWNSEAGTYVEESTLDGHSDWVRDVAFAPSPLPTLYIASASQDKTVNIWTLPPNSEVWKKTTLNFDYVCWRVSWSFSGNVLAVSGADNKISLWKENLKGEWEKTGQWEE